MTLDHTNCLIVKGNFSEQTTRRIYFRDHRGSSRMIFMVGNRRFSPRYEMPDQEDHRKGRVFLRDEVVEKLGINFY